MNGTMKLSKLSTGHVWIIRTFAWLNPKASPLPHVLWSRGDTKTS